MSCNACWKMTMSCGWQITLLDSSSFCVPKWVILFPAILCCWCICFGLLFAMIRKWRNRRHQLPYLDPDLEECSLYETDTEELMSRFIRDFPNKATQRVAGSGEQATYSYDVDICVDEQDMCLPIGFIKKKYGDRFKVHQYFENDDLGTLEVYLSNDALKMYHSRKVIIRAKHIYAIKVDTVKIAKSLNLESEPIIEMTLMDQPLSFRDEDEHQNSKFILSLIEKRRKSKSKSRSKDSKSRSTKKSYDHYDFRCDTILDLHALIVQILSCCDNTGRTPKKGRIRTMGALDRLRLGEIENLYIKMRNKSVEKEAVYESDKSSSGSIASDELRRGQGVYVERHFGENKKSEAMEVYVGYSALKDYKSKTIIVLFKDIELIYLGKRTKILREQSAPHKFFFSIITKSSGNLKKKKVLDFQCSREVRNPFVQHLVAGCIDVGKIPTLKGGSGSAETMEINFESDVDSLR